MRLRAVACLATGLVIVSLAACGVTAPRSSEGFADLDSLGLADTDRVLRLSLGPALLRFVASNLEDDPQTQELLRGLEGVRIRIYEIDGDAGRVAHRMGRMSGKLQKAGWEPVLQLRAADEQTHMLIKMSGHEMRGMTVLVSDGESEAVVINLMGEISPRQFSSAMVALEVDAAGVQKVDVSDLQGS